MLWVATEEEIAQNYAGLDDDGNLLVEEFQIDEPENVFMFPFKNGNTSVRGEDMANIFRKHMQENLPRDKWVEFSKLIKEYQKMAGDSLEPFHTKINKPGANTAIIDLLEFLGYDAIGIEEGGVMTYGIIKPKKSLIDIINHKAGFDPDQARDEDGKWTDGPARATAELMDFDEAIQDYTNQEYWEVNGYLRGEERFKEYHPEDIERIELLQKSLEHYLDENSQWQTSYRGIAIPREKIQAFLDDLNDDFEIEFPAFMSTTTDAYIMSKYLGGTSKNFVQVQMEVLGGKGANISEWSIYPEEKEVLYPPGTKWDVDILDIWKNDDGSLDTISIRLNEIL